MRHIKKFLLGATCLLLLMISWSTAITVKSAAEKQVELIEQASAYMEDEIFVRAVPLLEEAAAYNDDYTQDAEKLLKKVYLALQKTSGYERKYRNLLDKQMGREGAAPAIFEEAARYYLGISKHKLAFEALKKGIEATNDEGLIQLYEECRYEFKASGSTYQDVTAIHNGAIQVKLDGMWGLADSSGNLIIPCEYEKVSTYSDGQVVVKKAGNIYAVDTDNNRVALLKDPVRGTDFGNLNQNRTSIKTAKGWVLANAELTTADLAVDRIGMYTDEYIPAMLDGKWGFLDSGGEVWSMEPMYDNVIQDELGRSCAQKAFFVKEENQVLLYVDGTRVEGAVFEDAKPFADGWAAVKKGGAWGFIDTEGIVQIDYQFEEALSFGQHLAAVKIEDHWGYISRYGKLVIDPTFLEAKSFSDGSAPVKTGDGWQFITLLEFNGT